MELIPAYINTANIEMVDVKPIAEQHPSAYWALLIANMQAHGLADFERGKIYIPLQAVKEFLSSEWLNKKPTKDAASKMKTYLMRDGVSGHIKIGRSKSVEFREKTLQAQAPSIQLIAWLDKDVEAELHSKYKPYRQRGEWFALEPAQVAAIIDGFGFSVVSAGTNK